MKSYLCTLALALASTLVVAQSPAAAGTPAPAGDWQLRGGAALIMQPRYSGGKKLRTLGAPLLEARWRENFFLSTLRGAGYEMRLGEGAAVSLALAPDLYQRRRKDGPRLAALDEVKVAPALRLGSELAMGPVFANAVLTQRLGSGGKRGGRGLHAELELGYGLLNGPDLALALGVSATAMDGKLGQALYGVSAAEAARSGLRVHGVSAGLHSLGLFAQASYRLDEHWLLFAKAGLASLRGDAGESPVVLKARQPSLALALSRSF